MHWLDTSTLLVLSGAALIGLALGFVRPVFRLTALILAAAATVWLSPVVARLLGDWNGVPVHPATVLGVTFVTTLVLLLVTVAIVRRQVRKALPDSVLNFVAHLRWLDRLLGAAVAVALTAVAVGTVVYLTDAALAPADRVHAEGSTTLRHSREWIGSALGSVTDQDKVRIKEALDQLKRSKPAGAGAPKGADPVRNDKTGTMPVGEIPKPNPTEKADTPSEGKASDEPKK